MAPSSLRRGTVSCCLRKITCTRRPMLSIAAIAKAMSSTTSIGGARSTAATRMHCRRSKAPSLSRDCGPRPRPRSERMASVAASRCCVGTSVCVSSSAKRPIAIARSAHSQMCCCDAGTVHATAGARRGARQQTAHSTGRPRALASSAVTRSARHCTSRLAALPGVELDASHDACAPAVRQDGVRALLARGRPLLLLQRQLLLRQVPQEGGRGQGAAAGYGSARRVRLGQCLRRRVLPTRGQRAALLMAGELE
mmetsp:Transcript_25121/g.84674  ORF Transcript_25121/g.84674 Transcript_25121/m.84674 type:complete len:253 (+) Transcript_25121:1656-2414(+)